MREAIGFARLAGALAAAGLLACGITASHATEPAYPSRPVKLVVPSVPGGPIDAVSRLIGTRLSARLGASFYVENKPGGNVQIGANYVARSDPDGYTLLTTSPAHIFNPLLYSKLPYETGRDLTGVAMMARVPLLVVVNADLPIHTVADLVAWGKAHPDRLRYGSSGSGSTANLTGELISMHTGIRLEHIPYKGSAAALPDLMAGRFEVMIDTLQLFAPHIRSGKVRAIAFTGTKRVPALPDVPTFAQSGYPDVVANSWLAIVARGKTPPGVIEKLGHTVTDILAEPEVRRQIADFGMESDVMTPAQLNRYFVTESERWAKVIRAGKIRVE
ncbi:tripartite tricarboxylate transporter substrate binding protein (plasmid) [Cupriavidus pinatubonensis]|uniref:Bug family tripartite tricarboxylate transporter substrate binding protein n=1 Tax=Cupriavidus pinatubonensis TaxID=248026 RepID=UPI001C73673C|nr:tripartite tricarboxylate transporter substrate binding protein [Cupriavidus pinatubonensis]QYY33537.1 tripartite tricarboxylate transporter substrate binding protein [Cupriavidus pinatubonensis]